jgi:hypothetical protein
VACYGNAAGATANVAIVQAHDYLVVLDLQAERCEGSLPLEALANGVGRLLERTVVLQLRRKAREAGALQMLRGKQQLLSVQDRGIVAGRKVNGRDAPCVELDAPGRAQNRKGLIKEPRVVEEANLGVPQRDPNHTEAAVRIGCKLCCGHDEVANLSGLLVQE